MKPENFEAMYRLSPVQEGILFHSLHEPENSLYVSQMVCTLNGPLDAESLRQAWVSVLERHAALRTSFHWEEVAHPVQVISLQVSLPWEERDWRSLSAAEQERSLEELCRADRERGFDLVAPPLVRLTLVRTADRVHRLVWSFHHLILDGWSLPLVFREVFAAYSALSQGRPPQLGAVRHYRDFINWLQRRSSAVLEPFWRQSLEDFSAPTPLVAERSRSGDDGGGGRSRRTYEERGTALSEETTAELARIARRHGLTLNNLVQGAWALLLARYSGEEDVVFGVTVSGRSAPVPGIESMVGLFINTLPLRVRVDRGEPLGGWLRGIQEMHGELLQHEHAPLVDVHGWSGVPRGLPLFESIVVFQNFPLEKVIDQDMVRSLPVRVQVDHGVEPLNYPLALVAFDGARLELRLSYEVERIGAPLALRMLDHLRAVLGWMAGSAGSREEPVLTDLTLLGETERHQLLREWSDTARHPVNAPAAALAHELFAAQAERTPEAVAAVHAGEEMTYRELDRRASCLAVWLRGLGVGPEVVVGLFVDRSFDMLVGLLGVLKVGGTYLPFDPSYPRERLDFMRQDSGAAVMLTQEHLEPRLPAGAAHTVRLDTDWPVIARCPPGFPGQAAGLADPVAPADPDNAAYVIYTSGSTGRPKGAAITHRSLTAFALGFSERLGLRADDRVLQFAALSFDVTVEEIFPALLTGARIVLRDPDELVTTHGLQRAIEEEGVTVVELPTAFWHEWVLDLQRSGERPPACLRRVLTGTEQVLLERLAAWRRLGVPLVHVFGLTEVTVTSTLYLVEPEGDFEPVFASGLVPIGRPFGGNQVYVLDGAMQAVPVGVTGEIYMGGSGVARGYLNAPAQTAERFVPSSWTLPGERLYRTGDLGRWRADGNLEFLGRRDRQVKVRGFRIELGEVEAALVALPGVREAVVVARPWAPGDLRLVAYVAGDAGQAPEPRELKRLLAGTLPAYMLPAYFVALPALPLTANGKLDRRALPAPADAASAAGATLAAPRTPAEEILAAIWSDVLGVERLGVHDNFFELGGHSLLATRIVSQVRSAFRTELGLRELFEEPTVAGLAERVEEALREGAAPGAPALERVARGGALPLSFAQQRLWFIHQLDPGSPVHNMAISLLLEGELDVLALERSLSGVVRRHEALRTRFPVVAGLPVQQIDPPARQVLPVIDLLALAPAARLAEARRLGREEAVRPFDLAHGPLLRGALVRQAEDAWSLLFALHHIVSDGWSTSVMVREISALYSADLEGGDAALPELPIQYADYAAWQRAWLSGEVLAAALDHWRRRLAGAPPVLALPLDRPRPTLQSTRGALRPLLLGPDFAAQVRAVARQEGATLFMTLLAAFQSLLARLSGQDEVVVGTPIAGRNRLETEGLIGFFINTLALRSDLPGSLTFAELLHNVRATTLDAYAHQDLPFERLVEELAPERSLGHAPIFQVVLGLQNAPAEPFALPGLRMKPVADGDVTAEFDWTFDFRELVQGIGANLHYRTDLFDGTTIDRVLRGFRTLLAGAIEDPECLLGDLPLLDAAELHQVLGEWSVPGPGTEGTIGALFAAQVDRTPRAVAVVCEGESLSYAELDERSNRLARHLSLLGVGPEVLVGLCVERSLEMVVGLLGILKAGGAYVPLDPHYPAERLALLIEDTLLPVVVGQDRWLAELPVRGLTQLVALDTEWDWIASQSGERLEVEVSPESLAYVMYTSGSTGRPKGVGAVHRGVVRLVRETDYARFGPEEVFLHLAPLSFDASTLEIWGPLLNGGRLVVAPPGAPSLGELGSWIAAEDVTSLWLTAGLFHEMVERELSSLRPLRQLLAGGDVLQPSSVRRALSELPGLRLINGYGPTENTTFTACHGMSAAGEVGSSVWIGRPVAGTEVYVVDGAGRPAPVGVAGELLAGGSGLARGYVNRPDLTAERWVPDAWSGGWGRRLYRTGDLVRWRADSNLEFLGRADRQVKVRGYRIEPGEVESALLEDRRVREAVVVVREEGGDKRLAAYVVLAPGQSLTLGQMREHLGSRLPEAMLPTALVVLESLPLTANGKVDRAALPAPESAGGESSPGWSAARTPVEEILAAIWSEVLGVERVGIAESFFDLGGHSLLATRVISQLRNAFQVELGLHELFEEPTVAGLAARVERALREGLGVEAPPIAPVDRGGELPLSFAQQRLWFIDQLEPGSPLYNVPIVLRASGELSVAVLARALGEVVRRHEALRTVFSGDGGRARQVILPPAGFDIPLVDLSSLAPERRESLAVGAVTEEALRPFDLARGPLFRAGLWRLGAAEHLVLLAMPHIVSDGWSLGVLVREVAALYAAFAADEPSPLPELPVQYADFAAWQRGWLSGAVLERELAYWRERLAGAPPVLELPTDRPRPAVQSLRGAVRHFRLPAALSRALLALSRREGATLFMTLLAAFGALLSRLTGQVDLPLGTAVAGRNRAEIESLIGFFVNTLVLRSDLSADPRFTELLGRARGETLQAYAHQDLPFERLVEELAPERSLAYTPLFQVMLVLQNAEVGALALPGLRLEPRDLLEDVAKFDLSLAFAQGDDGLEGALSYSPDLFDSVSIARLAAQLERLLGAAVETPDLALGALPLLAAAEWHQIVVEWNATQTPFPRESTIPALFTLQAARCPRQVAWASGPETLLYEELDRRSGALARFLRRQGVNPGGLVGLCIERSAAMLVAMLGILKAGAAYLPLDAAYPSERLALMLEDSGTPLVITQESLAAKLPATAAQTVRLDSRWEEIAGAGDAALDSGATAEDLAYVIYTSGSTGRPKGVAVPHRAVVRLVIETGYVHFDAAQRIAQLSNLSFDAATFEIWGALLHGATLVGAPRDTALSPAGLADFLRDERISALFLTSALFTQVAQEVPWAFRSVRDLVVGGDAVDPGAVRRVLASGPPERLVNGYGPTENTTFSICCRVESLAASALAVPIGRPIANSRAYLLDARLQPVPLNGIGELYLGGEGLARGYLHQPELTRERFVLSPALPGERLYRTGDLARFAPDGRLEFRGRADQQIKLRGFRIELAEIELALTAVPGIAEAAVVVREDLAGGRGLVAYAVPDGAAEIPPAALRALLRDKLPDYMVPAHFVLLPALPLTPNGKVDRRWLAERGPLPGAEAAEGWTALRTPVEEMLAGLFAAVLGVEGVDAETDFFALGGHSLLATQLMSRVCAAFGVELPLRALFEQPTVAALAQEIEKASRLDRGFELPPLERVERSGELPLSFAQQRLWFLHQLDPGNASNHIPVPLRIDGALDAGRLAGVLDVIVSRHEALRTRFLTVQGTPVQVIDPPARRPLPVIDLRVLPEPRRQVESRRLQAEESALPFDLEGGPLLRTALLHLANDSWVALFTMHHIVSDGWSMGVLVREVSILYAASSREAGPALPELPVQYADFALWQRRWLRGSVLEAELGHWRAKLAGMPSLLELPLDRPRPPVRSTRSALRQLALGETRSRRLRSLSRGHGATVFMVLLAAYHALLARLSGQEDFAVGTPIAGRNRVETEDLIGFFVNTLALRVPASPDLTFAALLRKVREEVLDAYAHQDLPFEKIVEELSPVRSLAHAPLVQTVLVLQNAPVKPLQLPGLALSPLGLERTGSPFDLSLTLTDTESGFEGFVTYATDLFDRTTVERWISQLQEVLAALVEDAEIAVSDLPCLGEAERHQVAWEWSVSGLGAEGTIGALFAAQVDRTPRAVAVVCGGESLSYAELDERSNRLARHLSMLGVGPEVLVGLCVERSLEMVVGLLGILKAGGAYVPLDPHYPAERLALLIEDTLLPVVVGQDRWLAELRRRGLARLVALDAEWDRIASRSGERLDVEVSPESLAYVMYTSGSTGRPKGVGAVHRGVVRLVRETEYARFGPEEVFLHLAPLSFDASTLEIWGPLLNGGRLVVAPPGAPSLGELGSWIAAEGVTSLWLTAGLFHEMVERELSSLRPLRQLLAGGDVLQPSSVRRALSALPGLRLINGYGPTENTTFTACHGMSAAEAVGASVWIGRPVAGTEVYVVDGEGRPAPVGVAGELLAGGSGLARGYVNRPDLTAERWVPDAWSGGWGGRLYRTGDLVRWRVDGTLEFLGRADRQVKVRGYRIEPGEVESALLADRRVREAVVVVREDGGDKRLAAYVVLAPNQSLTLGQMREHLGSRLPEAMLPTALVVLESLPLTANGKVDRAALPAPESAGQESSPGWSAARTPVEEILAAIWSEVLGVERVGIAESFFDLGGHSLLATRVISQLRNAFQVELGLHELFEEPTVAGLAARVERALREGLGVEAPPIAPVPREGDLPLSFAQQRLWFIDQLEPGSPLYNVPIALRASGELSVAVLARALGEVVRRHEALRTVFAGEGGRARQMILPPAGFDLPLIDLSSLAPERRESLAAGAATEEALRPFDLARGPLLRAGLWRLSPTEHLILVAMHHIVSDGWSLGVLVREVAALYAAFAEEKPSPLPELPVQYADFAAWQRSWLSGEVLERELAHWRERLAGAPPVLELPTDRPRPAVQRPRGRLRPIQLAPEVASALTLLGRRQSATLFMVLLSAFQSLLGRLSGAADLCIGTPIAGRTRRETEDLIGFFVNTLVLRGDLAGDPRFVEHLGRVRGETLTAYAHQELPFEKLVEELAPERSLAYRPLFQVFLVLQNAPLGAVELPGVRLSPVPVEGSTAKFDLALSLAESAAGLAGFLEYDAELFDGSTIDRLAGWLESLLRSASGDPERRLSELELLSAEERQQLEVEWRGAEAVSPPAASVPAQLALWASRTPDALALVFRGESGEERLSYGELDRRAGALAVRLRALGAGRETPVGLLVERSLDLVVALLGIWRSGGAAVPLDPGQPPARLALLLEDALPAGASVLVSQSGLDGLLAELPLAGRPVVRVDGEPALDLTLDREIDREVDLLGEAAVQAHDLAYLLYTSGTTGRPKAVMVEHGSLAHTLAAVQEVFGFTSEDRMPVLARASFDIFLFELLAPLLAGGTAVLFGLRPTLDVARLVEELESATLLHAVPAVMHQVVRQVELLERRTACPRLRRVFVGGDAVGAELLESMREAFPGAAPAVLYGPTEATILASWDGAERGPGSWLGRPLPGVTVEVRDWTGALAPAGVAGELRLGGPGVARGYLGRPGLTAERFVPDASGWGRRAYRTGDRVRFAGAGRLEFLGRVDQQVKVRGVRIEPGEVEAALLACPGVREAAVLARRAGGGDERLVAFVAGTAPLESAELRGALESRLPAHMVPGHFVRLERLPLTRHGKVDRRALAALPLDEPAAEASRVAPRTPVEELLAGLFAELLHLESPGAEAHFFELGGHSLLATQLVARVREIFGVELPVRTVFEKPVLAELAAQIEALVQTGAPATAPIRREEGPPVLSFAQQRLWFVDRLAPGGTAYNIPAALRIRGDLDAEALDRALGAIQQRHASLRTTFAEREGEPVAVVAPAPLGALRRLDLPAAAVRPWLAEEMARPFDLERGPLLRAALLRVAPDDHVLALTVHHIAADGWSMGVLVRELTELYAAFREGRAAALPELPIQYGDFARWQREILRGEALAGEVASWRERLAGAPETLDLPVDRPWPAVPSGRGEARTFTLPAGLAASLRALARRESVTPFMLLLTGFAALLARWCGQDDICLGAPIAGRDRRETETLIGLLVNTLVLRADLRGEPGLQEALRRVREMALYAFAHPNLPFEKLVEELHPERSLSRPPLVQVNFALQNLPPAEIHLPGLVLEPLAAGSVAVKVELSLTLAETGEGFAGTLAYAADLFEAGTAERLAAGFARLLAAMAAAGPADRLLDLEILPAAERRQLLVGWSAVEDRPVDLCLHELFARQARRTPDDVALIFEEERWTYGELLLRSREVAAWLREQGVAPGDRVAILAGRSAERVAWMLGILAAGAAFVALDPEHPRARWIELLADVTPRLVLAVDPPEPPLPVPALRPGAASPLPAGPDQLDAGSLAYVVYTSGSTGRPKGIAASHRGAATYLEWVIRTYGLASSDVALQLAPLTFDASLRDTLAPLAAGGRVVLVPDAVARDPKALLERMRRHAVTCLPSVVPALLRALTAEALSTGPGMPSLRLVLASGSVLAGADAAAVRAAFGDGACLVNQYGPSEAALTSTWYPVNAVTDEPVPALPAGRPAASQRVFLLDRALRPVPCGAAGEIYLGGPGLAFGYLGQPDRTAEVFNPDPFGLPGARLYRTGDRGRYRPDGVLELLGRIDLQVKIRGQRVEPGEVEAALRSHPAVREVVVAARRDTIDSEPRLSAWVVSHAAEKEPLEEALRAFLAERLPAAMVPAEWARLDALPLTAHGKVDRSRLPAPGRVHAPSRPPADRIELELARLWEELLDVRPVGVDDDFFALGGHSLAAVRLMAGVRRLFGREVPVSELFRRPTLKALAGLLRDTGPDAPPRPWSPLVPLASGLPGEVPLFCVHGAAGSALVFADLARALGEETPVYGLEARGLGSGEPPLHRVEEMAELYLAAIREVRPQGPYRLLGYSMGSKIAFEIACRLEKAGEQVELLALLDIPAVVPEGFAEESGSEVPAEIRELPDFDHEIAQRHLDVLRANRTASLGWAPAEYGGAAVLFVAEEGTGAGAEDPTLGWSGPARGGVMVVSTPGDHFSMLRAPHVQGLVEKLSQFKSKDREMACLLR